LHVACAPQQRDREYSSSPAKNRSSPAIVGFTATPPMIALGPIAKWAGDMPITMTPNNASGVWNACRMTAPRCRGEIYYAL
jgi:hypothetical protein